MSAYSDRVIADGATAYWRLGESSGTQAADSIGTNHGTISGGVTLGQSGALVDGDTAMKFASGLVKATAVPLNSFTVFTVEGWVNIRAGAPNYGYIVEKSISNVNNSCWALFFYLGAWRWRVINGAGSIVDVTGPIAVTGQWVHLVGVNNGSNSWLYLNGVQVGTATVVGNKQGVGDLVMADASPGPGGWPLDGHLDEVAIYPTALTASQIAAHYALGRTNFPVGSYPHTVVSDGPSAYWRLGETSGTTAVDVVGGNHGTISGGVTLGQAGALADGNTAMAFDGSTGVVRVPASSALNLPQFTAEAWVKRGTGPVAGLVEKTIADAVNSCWMFLLEDNLWKFRIKPAGPFITLVGSAAVVGQWMHLVGVHDGTNSRLYINGNQVATQTTGAVTQGLGDIYIGQLVASILPFDGSLDEVAIYPTALTPAQIAAHYAAQMWNPIPPIPWAVVCGSLPQFALSR